MLDRFLHYNFSLFEKKKIILGCSGGIDSMTLLHLLQQCNCEIIVCHIDHLTRNGQSTQDQHFIETYCQRINIPVVSHDYHHKGGNFQGESRKFRYQVFHSILDAENGDFVVTAHNMNDNVESYFIRSARGTGLKGLKGMKVNDPPFLRPLLPFKRKDIEEYAVSQLIPYVEDPSNSSGDYLRNTIRNEVLPRLEPFIPHLVERVSKTISNLSKDFQLLQSFIDEEKEKYMVEHVHFTEVDLIKLKTLLLKNTLLFHLLREYGINEDQVELIFESNTGAIFETDGYLFNKDRDRLIVMQKEAVKTFSMEIPGEGVFSLPLGNQLQISLMKPPTSDCGGKEMVLSSSRIHFPLTLRSWRVGDRFCPAGMNGQSKKVSKFLKDLKVPRIYKSNVLVLESQDGHICGIPGFRADHRFLPEADEAVYFIKLVKANR